jgi:hemolysin-activating ACP:hemolysin acyltransferase
MYSLDTIIGINGMSIDAQQKYATIVGLIGQLMALQPDRCKRLAPMLRALVPAVGADQVKLYFDRHGVFVGYVAWATLSDEAEHKMLASPPFDLSAAERTSGTSLWITDLHLVAGHAPAVLADLRDSVFAHVDQVTYFRFKGHRRIAKRLDRHGRHAFFAPAPGRAAR